MCLALARAVRILIHHERVGNHLYRGNHHVLNFYFSPSLDVSAQRFRQSNLPQS